ncbi:MAG: hypothetical protein RSD04_02025 [Clostridia bacterium]
MGIQEIINSIASAEREADEIVRLATSKASEMQMKAETSASSAIATAKTNAKTCRKQAAAQAEINLKTVVEERIAQGEKNGALSLQSVDQKIDKAVEFLTGRLVEQYVNR